MEIIYYIVIKMFILKKNLKSKSWTLIDVRCLNPSETKKKNRKVGKLTTYEPLDPSETPSPQKCLTCLVGNDKGHFQVG